MASNVGRRMKLRCGPSSNGCIVLFHCLNIEITWNNNNDSNCGKNNANDIHNTKHINHHHRSWQWSNSIQQQVFHLHCRGSVMHGPATSLPVSNKVGVHDPQIGHMGYRGHPWAGRVDHCEDLWSLSNCSVRSLWEVPFFWAFMCLATPFILDCRHFFHLGLHYVVYPMFGQIVLKQNIIPPSSRR